MPSSRAFAKNIFNLILTNLASYHHHILMLLWAQQGDISASPHVLPDISSPEKECRQHQLPSHSSGPQSAEPRLDG